MALGEAIARTDEETGGYPAYYMINCAHPTHFRDVIEAGGGWRNRIWGIRANASKRSHKELDESPDLDAGNPVELGAQYRELKSLLPRLSIAGGCCGTDHRHVAEMCRALQATA
ncbi:Homocysteine S-methyltransferase [compost metagenome]